MGRKGYTKTNGTYFVSCHLRTPRRHHFITVLDIDLRFFLRLLTSLTSSRPRCVSHCMLLGVVCVDLTVCLGRQVGREPTEERKEKLRKLEAMAKEYENLEMQADALKVKEVCTRVLKCA